MSEGCTASISFDGESADEFRQFKRVARVAGGKCFECNDQIPVGVEFVYLRMQQEGEWRTYRICKACQTVADEFCSDGHLVGYVWEGMEESVFEEGAPLQACLNRVVGVAAKTKIRDAWMRWKRLV